MVAIFGTTISPYLFFWQAAQEVEEVKNIPERKPLLEEPKQGPDAIIPTCITHDIVAHCLVVMDAMRSGVAMRSLHAWQQAVTTAS